MRSATENRNSSGSVHMNYCKDIREFYSQKTTSHISVESGLSDGEIWA